MAILSRVQQYLVIAHKELTLVDTLFLFVSLGQLWRPLATNSLSVTSQMLWSLTKTNYDCHSLFYPFEISQNLGNLIIDLYLKCIVSAAG